MQENIGVFQGEKLQWFVLSAFFRYVSYKLQISVYKVNFLKLFT